MRKFLSEAIGTFFLVLMGCSAIIVNDLYGDMLGHFGVSAAFGLIVMIMIYSIGNISGAHMNPAVTFGFFLARKIPLKLIPIYISAQTTGALTASLLLKIAFPDHPNLGSTLITVDPSTAFIMEVILTGFLMFVVLNVSTGHYEKGIMAGVAVGATITLCALTGGPLTGASMNPIRSLGPALFSMQTQHLWIYLTAPFAGAAVVSQSCCVIQREDCCDYQKNQQKEKN